MVHWRNGQRGWGKNSKCGSQQQIFLWHALLVLPRSLNTGVTSPAQRNELRRQRDADATNAHAQTISVLDSHMFATNCREHVHPHSPIEYLCRVGLASGQLGVGEVELPVMSGSLKTELPRPECAEVQIRVGFQHAAAPMVLVPTKRSSDLLLVQIWTQKNHTANVAV